MEKEKSPLLEIVDAVRRIDWTRRTSPLIFAVLLLVGLGALALVLKQMGIVFVPGVYIWVYCVSLGLSILWWLYVRWYRPFDKNVLSIGFALSYDDYSRESYAEIMASFRRDLEQHGLKGAVKIKELPSDLRLSSALEAEKYLKKKDLRVLIWGDTTRATVGNSEAVTIFNVNVTCQHRVRAGDDKDAIHAALSDGARRGSWTVQDTNSLSGLRLVSGNLLEISTYVLAISLWSVREIKYVEKAALILENLRVRLQPRARDTNFPNLGDFKIRIGKRVYGILMQVTYYYMFDKRDFHTAKKWAEKLYQVAPRDYDVNMSMARISWELGDQSMARSFTRTARDIKPKESLPYLNLAFFHFNDGSYVRALAIYKKLKPNISSKTNILDVIDFLEREFDTSRKPALFFAAAWLSVRYGDTVRGREMLQSFLEMVENKSDFRKLVEEAKRVISSPAELSQ